LPLETETCNNFSSVHAQVKTYYKSSRK